MITLEKAIARTTKLVSISIMCGLFTSGCSSTDEKFEAHEKHNDGNHHRLGQPGAVLYPIGLLLGDYDSNRDKAASYDEIRSGIKASFAEADSNASGNISPNEFARWSEQTTGVRYPTFPGWMAYDANYDTSVTFAEFESTLLRTIERFDKNHDGIIRRNETIMEPRGTAHSPNRSANPPSMPSGGSHGGGGHSH